MFVSKKSRKGLKKVYISNEAKLIFLILLLFIIGYILRITFSGYSPSFLDFGFEASTAERISNGQVPYRDFFTLINPLHFLLTSVFFKIFQNISGFYIFASIVGSMISIFIFLIAYRLKDFRAGVIAWILSTVFSQIFIGVSPNYSFTATLFFLVAFYLLIPSLVENKFGTKTLVLSGVFASLSFWTKQTIGVYFIIGLAAYLLIRKNRLILKRALPPFLYGYLFVCLLFGLYLTLNGALGDWLNNTIIMTVTFAGEAKINPPVFDLGISDNFSMSIVTIEKIIFNIFLAFIIFELVKIFKSSKDSLSLLKNFFSYFRLVFS